jgi:hypothetical protein
LAAFCSSKATAMKNAIMIFLFSVECFISYSQDGFLFQPQLGIGVSKMSPIDPHSDLACNCSFKFDGQTTVPTYNIETKLAYQLDHFRIISGLQFIRTGSPGNLDLVSYPTNEVSLYAAHAHYDHLLIPVSLGYNITLINKWGLTPELGTNILFIKGSESNSWLSNSNKSLLSVKINFEKKVRDNLSIVITPAFFKIKDPVYTYSYFGDSQRWESINEMFFLQGGMLWHLPHKAETGNSK